MNKNIAIVGAGLIGRAWAIVFARAGLNVTLHDSSSEALDQALESIRVATNDLANAELVTDTAFIEHIHCETHLETALANVEYVQECGPETLQAKQDLFAELDRKSAPRTILASSTSGILASAFSAKVKRPERCLVVHPVNPPYLIPLVEIAPSSSTSQTVIKRACEIQASVGQVPILVRHEIQGFVLNRLQGALLNEAIRLVDAGYVSVEDLDNTVKHGLGLRWAFMGPLETIDLNAPGGIADYASRYGPLYSEMGYSQSVPPDWGPTSIAKLEHERRLSLSEPNLPARQEWRDQQLMALAAHKRHMENTDPIDKGGKS